MPTSYSESIPSLIKVMQKVSPKKVLDIGIGNGKYALLLKEYVSQDVIVDGVEAWEPYVTKVHKALYRKIFLEDITKMDLPGLGKYDLYLMIDVIEHLPKATAHRILRELNGLVLISTPIEDYRAHYENHYEDHVSHWKPEDFDRYYFEDYSNDLSTIVLVNTAETKNKNDQATKDLEAVYGSISWKITKPLRKANSILRKKK